jgi:hypothetical protein
MPDDGTLFSVDSLVSDAEVIGVYDESLFFQLAG